MKFDNSDYEILKNCPWCMSPHRDTWGKQVRGFETVTCRSCGLIYVKNRLNISGLQKFYAAYLSTVHQANASKNKKRQIMYELEFGLINRYAKRTNVLDVGCSGGYFLDCFYKHGYECFGVEFGEEAAREAARKHKVWKGDFAVMDIDRKFDLIVFRGVIEHITYPRTYLEKAVSLLNNTGLIFITSTPNAKAFCCSLFKEKWNQHVPEGHLMHFSPKHFDEWFITNGFVKIDEHFLYEETPYSNPAEDILTVARAIEQKKHNSEIPFESPPFYGNMLSLTYRKGPE